MYITRYSDPVMLAVCVLCSYLHSLISSLLIMNSHERFIRNCIHIPFGFVGGFMLNFKDIYGIIYFILLIVYQTLEEIENLYKNNKDYSWYDIEGYAIGFVNCVYYFYLLQRKHQKYEPSEI